MYDTLVSNYGVSVAKENSQLVPEIHTWRVSFPTRACDSTPNEDKELYRIYWECRVFWRFWIILLPGPGCGCGAWQWRLCRPTGGIWSNLISDTGSVSLDGHLYLVEDRVHRDDGGKPCVSRTRHDDSECVGMPNNVVGSHRTHARKTWQRRRL